MTRYTVKIADAQMNRPFSLVPIKLPDEAMRKIAEIIALHVPADCWLYTVSIDVQGEIFLSQKDDVVAGQMKGSVTV